MLVSDVNIIGRLLSIRDFKRICCNTTRVSKSVTAFGRVAPIDNEIIRRFDCFDVCIKDGNKRRYFQVSKRVLIDC